MVFGAHPPSDGREPARLSRTVFRGAALDECRFAHVELDRADLRGCRLTGCDLRYATLRRVTLADAVLEDCDLYRAQFAEGCVFEGATLDGVSLSRADLGGVVDLRRRSFEDGARPALVQEDGARYAAFLARTVGDRPDDVRRAEARRHDEAALVYRHLAGVWDAQGAFPDAAWAYVRSKRHERASLSPRHPGTRTRRAQWLGLHVADALSGFGERLGRVVLWVLALGLLPGLLYALLGGVVDARGDPVRALDDTLLFSLGRLATAGPERLRTGSELVEWVSVAQTLLGIGLLGLLGFVLGNKLRSS